MSVTYSGIIYTSSTFAQQGPPTFRRADGTSQAVVKFKGPSGAAASVIAGLEKQQLPAINLFGRNIDVKNFSGFDADDGPVWTTISVFFDVGTIVQEPKYSTSRGLQTIVIPFEAIGSTNFNMTVQYRPIETTWRWYEDERPSDAPREKFKKMMSGASPWDDLAYVAVDVDGLQFASPDVLLQMVTGLGIVEEVSSFEVEELISGKFWECRSIISRTIDPVRVITEIIEEE